MQEFDLEIKDKRGIDNVVADHLYRISGGLSRWISDSFPDENILEIQSQKLPWYARIVNYLVPGQLSEDCDYNDRKINYKDIHYSFYDEPELFHQGIDHILRRCMPEEEQWKILESWYSSFCGGHYSPKITTYKVYIVDSFGQNYFLTLMNPV